MQLEFFCCGHLSFAVDTNSSSFCRVVSGGGVGEEGGCGLGRRRCEVIPWRTQGSRVVPGGAQRRIGATGGTADEMVVSEGGGTAPAEVIPGPLRSGSCRIGACRRSRGAVVAEATAA